MSIVTLGYNLRSQFSESGLPETLNITTFNITTHATAGDLPNKENADDLVEINGKTYITVSHRANHRARSVPSWIWDHGREPRLLVSISSHNTLFLTLEPIFVTFND
jgi:hypothetical protein